jgi:hypothetical protein
MASKSPERENHGAESVAMHERSRAFPAYFTAVEEARVPEGQTLATPGEPDSTGQMEPEPNALTCTRP